MERLKDGFRDSNTAVLGLSVDSVYCHANWGARLGGISFPLLADFHPKGAVASAYGVYLADSGIADRATVIIDASGIVQYAESVGPGGVRDIDSLLSKCTEISTNYKGTLQEGASSDKAKISAELFIKSSCGPSEKALLACTNLHLGDAVRIRNVSEEPDSRDALVSKAGKDQAPCLVTSSEVIHEADRIVKYMVDHCQN